MPWNVREREKLVQATALGEVLKSGGTGLGLLRGKGRAVALPEKRSTAMNVGGSSTVAIMENCLQGLEGTARASLARNLPFSPRPCGEQLLKRLKRPGLALKTTKAWLEDG